MHDKINAAQTVQHVQGHMYDSTGYSIGTKLKINQKVDNRFFTELLCDIVLLLTLGLSRVPVLSLVRDGVIEISNVQNVNSCN